MELAHRGVLVLDELPDFRRDVLGALRQPMEEGVLRVAWSGERGPRPVEVMLLSTMRACPCGRLERHREGCSCARAKIVRYRRRASEPLGSLFDIQCEIRFTCFQATTGNAAARTRIEEAREIARARGGGGNAAMSAEDIRRFCQLDRAGKALQVAAFEQLGFTPGVFGRVLRVARTVADLAGKEVIRSAHLAEALSYRSLLLPGPFLEGVQDGKRPLALDQSPQDRR